MEFGLTVTAVIAIIVTWQWVGRSQRRKQMRELLGELFSPDRAYIQRSTGIVVLPSADCFAVATRGKAAIVRPDELLNVKFTGQSAQNLASCLAIETRNDSFPAIYIEALLDQRRLRQIFGRLEAMKASASRDDARAEGPTLETAVLRLAEAVTSLTEMLSKRQ